MDSSSDNKFECEKDCDENCADRFANGVEDEMWSGVIFTVYSGGIGRQAWYGIHTYKMWRFNFTFGSVFASENAWLVSTRNFYF